jgi:hypothetical protein
MPCDHSIVHFLAALYQGTTSVVPYESTKRKFLAAAEPALSEVERAGAQAQRHERGLKPCQHIAKRYQWNFESALTIPEPSARVRTLGRFFG